jgi:hypothetical protein
VGALAVTVVSDEPLQVRVETFNSLMLEFLSK